MSATVGSPPQAEGPQAGRSRPGGDSPRPLVEHLTDLRGCLIRAAAGWGLGSALFYAAFPSILPWLLRPPVEKLAYLSPAEPFFAQVKLSMIGGVVLSFPWILYQAWLFASPGLRDGERRAFLRLIPASYALFLAGGALGLWVAAPLGLRFLMGYSSSALVPTITVDGYLGFLGYMTLGLGLFFQTPVVLFGLAALGWVDPPLLARYRRHVLLGLLVAAAVLTPGPDVYSQALIAVPAYLLFELSLLAIRLARRRLPTP